MFSFRKYVTELQCTKYLTIICYDLCNNAIKKHLFFITFCSIMMRYDINYTFRDQYVFRVKYRGNDSEASSFVIIR